MQPFPNPPQKAAKPSQTVEDHNEGPHNQNRLDSCRKNVSGMLSTSVNKEIGNKFDTLALVNQVQHEFHVVNLRVKGMGLDTHLHICRGKAKAYTQHIHYVLTIACIE